MEEIEPIQDPYISCITSGSKISATDKTDSEVLTLCIFYLFPSPGKHSLQDFIETIDAKDFQNNRRSVLKILWSLENVFEQTEVFPSTLKSIMGKTRVKNISGFVLGYEVFKYVCANLNSNLYKYLIDVEKNTQGVEENKAEEIKQNISIEKNKNAVFNLQYENTRKSK